MCKGRAGPIRVYVVEDKVLIVMNSKHQRDMQKIPHCITRPYSKP
jgi:hypothetical protein